jgi:hypothetical protein
MVSFLSVELFWQVLIVSSLLIYSYYLYRRFVVYRPAKAWVGCQTISHNQWLLHNRAGQFYAATLRADTFVSSWLIVMRWDVQIPEKLTHKTTAILFKAMLSKPVWRQLCCNLRWQPHIRRIEKIKV